MRYDIIPLLAFISSVVNLIINIVGRLYQGPILLRNRNNAISHDTNDTDDMDDMDDDASIQDFEEEDEIEDLLNELPEIDEIQEYFRIFDQKIPTEKQLTDD